MAETRQRWLRRADGEQVNSDDGLPVVHAYDETLIENSNHPLIECDEHGTPIGTAKATAPATIHDTNDGNPPSSLPKASAEYRGSVCLQVLRSLPDSDSAPTLYSQNGVGPVKVGALNDKLDEIRDTLSQYIDKFTSEERDAAWAALEAES